MPDPNYDGTIQLLQEQLDYTIERADRNREMVKSAYDDAEKHERIVEESESLIKELEAAITVLRGAKRETES